MIARFRSKSSSLSADVDLSRTTPDVIRSATVLDVEEEYHKFMDGLIDVEVPSIMKERLISLLQQFKCCIFESKKHQRKCSDLTDEAFNLRKQLEEAYTKIVTTENQHDEERTKWLLSKQHDLELWKQQFLEAKDQWRSEMSRVESRLAESQCQVKQFSMEISHHIEEKQKLHQVIAELKRQSCQQLLDLQTAVSETQILADRLVDSNRQRVDLQGRLVILQHDYEGQLSQLRNSYHQGRTCSNSPSQFTTISLQD